VGVLQGHLSKSAGILKENAYQIGLELPFLLEKHNYDSMKQNHEYKKIAFTQFVKKLGAQMFTIAGAEALQHS
jgi:hypothetical protein